MSYDCVNWTRIAYTSIKNYYTSSVTTYDFIITETGKYVVGGYSAGNPYHAVLMTSTDYGVSWTCTDISGMLGTSNKPNYWISTPGKLIMGTNNNQLWYSTDDCITWTQITGATASHGAYSPTLNKYVFVCWLTQSVAYSTTDLINFTDISSTIPTGWRTQTIKWCIDRFVLFPAANSAVFVILHSTDGLTFTQVAIPGGTSNVPRSLTQLGRWQNTPLTLNTQIADVSITNPQNNDVLRYNSSTGKWYNSAV